MQTDAQTYRYKVTKTQITAITLSLGEGNNTVIKSTHRQCQYLYDIQCESNSKQWCQRVPNIGGDTALLLFPSSPIPSSPPPTLPSLRSLPFP